MYDEDIRAIINSNGLIGLNLDQHILGADRVRGEFFDLNELNYILSDYQDTRYKRNISEGEFTDEVEVQERELNEIKHLRHLCNNILRIIKVGGEKAWEHICVGSDFYGLINPINYCKDMSEFPKLESGLLQVLPQMIEEDNSHNYDRSNMAQKLRGIMYENGFNFLTTYFK